MGYFIRSFTNLSHTEITVLIIIILFIQYGYQAVHIPHCRILIEISPSRIALHQTYCFCIIIRIHHFNIRIALLPFSPRQIQHVLNKGRKFCICTDTVRHMKALHIRQARKSLRYFTIQFFRRDHVFRITGEDYRNLLFTFF